MIAQTYLPEKDITASTVRQRTGVTGFASPASDYPVDRLNLNDQLIKHPSTTFFMKVRGKENENLGLNDGDILVIDRSLAPRHDCLVLAVLNGEYIVCRLLEHRGNWFAETGDGKKIEIKPDENRQSSIWGRVTHVIHSCI